jgi:hypothetical protein
MMCLSEIETAFPIAFTCAHEGTRHLSQEISNPQNHGRKANRQRIQMASHLHNTTSECPYDQSAAQSQN